jgi:tripartite-type tricarboxylate transporter receptor subunit TctC
VTWHKKGFVRVLIQMGSRRDSRLANVPTIYELMDQHKTPEAGKRVARVVLTAAGLGRPIVAPPGLAADRVKILRDAYAKTLKDPDLTAEAKKRRWEIDPISGDDLEELAKDVITQPKEVIERMKWVMGE